MSCGWGGVIVEEATPNRIEMFHYRIKLVNQNFVFDLQGHFPLRLQMYVHKFTHKYRRKYLSLQHKPMRLIPHAPGVCHLSLEAVSTGSYCTLGRGAE